MAVKRHPRPRRHAPPRSHSRAGLVGAALGLAAAGTAVGVATYIITAAQYGWVQTRGICSTLIAGTPALGAMVMTPSTAAGSAVIMTTTNLVVAQLVGRMCQIGVDGKNNWVNLDID